MTKQVKTKTVITKIDEQTKDSFKIVAGNSNRTESDYLRQLIKYAIDKKLKF